MDTFKPQDIESLTAGSKTGRYFFITRTNVTGGVTQESLDAVRNRLSGSLLRAYGQPASVYGCAEESTEPGTMHYHFTVHFNTNRTASSVRRVVKGLEDFPPMYTLVNHITSASSVEHKRYMMKGNGTGSFMTGAQMPPTKKPGEASTPSDEIDYVENETCFLDEIRKGVESGKYKCVHDIQEDYVQRGMFGTYVHKHRVIKDAFIIARDRMSAIRQKENVESYGYQGFCEWLHHILLQDDPLGLLDMMDTLCCTYRTMEDMQSFMLWGGSGSGKSWLLSWLDQDPTAGRICPSSRGVGKWEECLEKRVIIIDDISKAMLNLHSQNAERETVTNLLVGQRAPIKVVGSSRTTLQPPHIATTANPDAVVLPMQPPFKRRFKVFTIKPTKPNTAFPIPVNIHHVRTYCDRTRDIRKMGFVGCSCFARPDVVTPCWQRLPFSPLNGSLVRAVPYPCVNSTCIDDGEEPTTLTEDFEDFEHCIQEVMGTISTDINELLENLN